MIAVGSDDTNTAAGGKVFIFEYNESSRWGISCICFHLTFFLTIRAIQYMFVKIAHEM